MKNSAKKNGKFFKLGAAIILTAVLAAALVLHQRIGKTVIKNSCAKGANMNNIIDFGAVGDGVTDNTQAIQKAIDAGGVVYVPAGVFVTGTIYLRSNGGLELAPGAVLLGSPDKSKYNAPDFCPQNSPSISEKASGAHLIVALEVENVVIRGEGTIDGNRPAFFDPEKCSRKEFTGWRPSQMLFFCESKNIHISGVTLKNSPYWACFLHGCRDLTIRGIRVSNLPSTAWNGDGIDIDCCTNVTVSDCIIRSADDVIAVRAAGTRRLKNAPGICENIVITNCVLMGGHCGVRFGVGEGIIRNCAVSNLVISETRFGLGVHSSYLADINKSKGCQVENITFDNIVMNTGLPIYVSATCGRGVQEKSARQIRNISFSNIRAKGYWNVLLEGNLDKNISDVQFSNITLEITDDDKYWETIKPEERPFWLKGFRRPCAIYAGNMKNCRFRNVTVRWSEEADFREAGLMLKDCEEMDFSDCRIAAPRCGVPVKNDNGGAKFR